MPPIELPETQRLFFRKMKKNDFPLLCGILQDAEVMYAWGHAFSAEEVHDWIERNIARYHDSGCGYWLAFEKNSGECIGQLGVVPEKIYDVAHSGVGWILSREHWHKGYATEGGAACIDFAFRALNAPRVVAAIRPENAASIRVAERIGMRAQGKFDKAYNNQVMPHILYVARPPRITVSDYNPQWTEDFDALANLLAPVLAQFGGRLEHVGSTSVPGLAAKPIVDADYILADVALWPCVQTALAELGFLHRGDGGLPGREMFTESLRLAFRHHLYVCRPDSVHLANHLCLRDFLRKNPDAASQYGALKKSLPAIYSEDIDAYCAGKSDLLSEFLSISGFDAADIEKINTLNKAGRPDPSPGR